jgi:hypothetical protein
MIIQERICAIQAKGGANEPRMIRYRSRACHDNAEPEPGLMVCPFRWQLSVARLTHLLSDYFLVAQLA